MSGRQYPDLWRYRLTSERLMGDNFWPYGIGPNRKTLDALFQYSYEQGLASKRLSIEDLFHPSTLQLVEDA